MQKPTISFTELSSFSLKRWLVLRRSFLYGLTLLVLTLVGGVAVLVPEVFTDKALYDQLGTEQQNLALLQNKTQTLQRVKNLQNDQSIQKINLLLPSEKPLLQMLATANVVASQSGVVVDKIETSPGRLATGSSGLVTATPVNGVAAKSPVKGAETLYIEVTVHGELSQINSFIQNVEHAAPLIDISKIALTPVAVAATPIGTAVPPTQFQALLGMTTYYFVDGTSMSVSQELPQIGVAGQQLVKDLDTFSYPVLQTQQGLQGGGLNDLFKANQAGETAQ